MSRSKRKTPKRGVTTAKTEKENKKETNRLYRRITKLQVKKGVDEVSTIREVSNVYAFDKDGKMWIEDPNKKDLSK